MSTKNAFLVGLAFTTVQLFSSNPQVERPVVPADLTGLISLADKVVVLENPMKDAKVLFSSSNTKDLLDLKEAAVVIAPKHGESFHCMCIGEPAIKLFKGNSELAHFTNHHGFSIRCSLWTSDAEVLDREKWLKWFDDRKITGPRIEVESQIAQEKKSLIDEGKWLTAMPSSLKPYWSEEMKYYAGPIRPVDLPRLDSALKVEFPNSQVRILALLTWYGSGAGPWSGYPGYESVAELLLITFSTSELIETIQSNKLTPSQLEGAARLFAGHEYATNREGDLKLLPAILKENLLKHVRGTMTKESYESDWTVKDKWSRAYSVFASK